MTLVCALCAVLPAQADADELFYVSWDPYSGTNAVAIKVYYGSTTNPALGNFRQMIRVPLPATTLSVSNVVPGYAHFQATAISFDGVESRPSVDVFLTNRNFAPVNFRLVPSTNQTAALWIEHWPTNALVEASPDMQTWSPWVNIKSFESAADIRSMFIAADNTGNRFFRLAPPRPPIILSPPLPVGAKLN